MVAEGRAWLPGGCIGYDEIQSMSRQYASYWNAFLSYYDTVVILVKNVSVKMSR